MQDDTENPISNGSTPKGDDRDEKGRYLPGNGGGPGNPRSRTARDLRDRLDAALAEVCTADDLLAALRACIDAAKAGDVAALKLLIERIAGKPPQHVDMAMEVTEPRQPPNDKVIVFDLTHAPLDLLDRLQPLADELDRINAAAVAVDRQKGS